MLKINVKEDVVTVITSRNCFFDHDDVVRIVRWNMVEADYIILSDQKVKRKFYQLQYIGKNVSHIHFCERK